MRGEATVFKTKPGHLAIPGGVVGVVCGAILLFATSGSTDQTQPDKPREARSDETTTQASSNQLTQILGQMSNEELLELLSQDTVPPELQQAVVRDQELKSAAKQELKRRLPGRTVAPDNSQATQRDHVSRKVVVTDAQATDADGPKDDVAESSTSAEEIARPKEHAPVFHAPSMSLHAQALRGQPFGVAQLELCFDQPDQQPRLYPDQPLTLVEDNHRVFYPVFDVEYRAKSGQEAWRASGVKCYFLFRGTSPLNLTLHAGETALVRGHRTAVANDHQLQRKTQAEWWRAFAEQRTYASEHERGMHRFLIETLARRFSLQAPVWKSEHEKSFVRKDLEHQFEHSVRLLLGIESVALAMQQTSDSATVDPSQVANLPLPAARPLRSVPVPHVPPTVSVEPIAHLVPEECFYVRTENLDDYRWFREFLLRWGGTLEDIVAQKAIATQTRRTLQHQLALYPESLSIVEADRLIDDIALIGLDPFFREGAAIGVLVKARDSVGVRKLIRSHREQCMRDFPNAREEKIWVGRNAVLRLSTDTQRVRSFYAIVGDYHLVTNSHTLVKRFFETAEGKQSLADLNEFRYAKSQTAGIQNSAVFLYLSDPFFRNLISPHTRVEMQRRQRSIDNIRKVRMARLMAKAEASPASTIDELVEAGFLSADVNVSSDGTRLGLRENHVVDSRRGLVGSFVPIADMPQGLISISEKQAYHAFIARYSKEWPMMDPVNLVLTRDITPNSAEQRVGMQIMVAPYATQRYEALSRHLAPPSNIRVVPKSDDLISVDTTIQTHLGGGTRHTFYAALRDADVDYAIENGEIELLGRHHGSYAKTFSYVAFSPPSFEVIRILARNFAGIDLPPQGSVRPRPVSPALALPPPGTVYNAPAAVVWMFAHFAASGGISQIAANSIPMLVDGHWAIVSLNESLRNNVRGTLHTAPLDRPSQVYFRMGELEGSRVEPYINAYTYLNARRISAENARWISHFAQQFHVSPDHASRTLQYVIDAEAVCPLGGSFVQPSTSEAPMLVSDSWKQPTLYQEKEVPASWHFPFLDWVRRLEIDFQLKRPKLMADVTLLVRSEVPQAKQDVVFRAFKPPVTVDDLGIMPVHLDPSDQETWQNNTIDDAPDPTVGFIEPPQLPAQPTRLASDRQVISRQDWILGVRVQPVQPSTIGAQVKLVHPGSPAIRSELRVGDFILAVNGQRITDVSVLQRAVQEASRRGNDVLLRVRSNDRIHTILVPLRN